MVRKRITFFKLSSIAAAAPFSLCLKHLVLGCDWLTASYLCKKCWPLLGVYYANGFVGDTKKSSDLEQPVNQT